MLTALPFGTALALLFSAFGVAFSLLGLRREPLLAVVRSPIASSALLLFGWLALSSLWAVAPRDELIEGVWKYRKLIYAVLVATSLLACRKNPEFLINFFLAGCAIVAFGSLASRFGFMEYVLGPPAATGGWPIGGTAQKSWFYVGGPENPTFGRNHITQGAFLVFASMFASGRSWSAFLGQKRKLGPGLLWLAVSVFYLCPVFWLQGRSGYLLAFIGGAFWGLFALFRLRTVARFLPLLLAVGVIGTLAFSSPHFFNRSYQAVDDVVRYSRTGEQTSQGERIRFWRAGLELAAERPLLGYGAGGYAQAYSELSEQPVRLRDGRSQPHSEYVIILVQGGFVGLTLLGALLLFAASKAYRCHNFNDMVSIFCVTLLFSVYASFNSALWDLAEGHLFAVITGLILSTSMMSNVGQGSS